MNGVFIFERKSHILESLELNMNTLRSSEKSQITRHILVTSNLYYIQLQIHSVQYSVVPSTTNTQSVGDLVYSDADSQSALPYTYKLLSLFESQLHGISGMDTTWTGVGSAWRYLEVGAIRDSAWAVVASAEAGWAWAWVWAWEGGALEVCAEVSPRQESVLV